MGATILTSVPREDITGEILSACAGSSVSQIIIDEQDCGAALPDWFSRVRDDLDAPAAQMWVIARQEMLGDVLRAGDDVFGPAARLGISTWDTGARGSGGFSSDVRFLIVWKTGQAARAISIGKTKRTVKRPLTRKGRKERELEFPAGSLAFDSDGIHPAAQAGAVHTPAMTVVDGENWNAVTIRAPFTLDQEGLDAALSEGSKITITGTGEQTQIVAVASQDAGRPFPALLSPRLSNVTSAAEAVRVTRDLTGRRVHRAVPDGLAELIVAAGSRRGELVLTIGGPCSSVPAAAAAGHRSVVHVASNQISTDVAAARLLAAGVKADVRNLSAVKDEPGESSD